MKPEWSKSYMIKPRDHFVSHVFIKVKRFVPSYERDPCPAPITWLLGMEYGRIWRRECEQYVNTRAVDMKPKRIRNDYRAFLRRKAEKSRGRCKM